MSAFGRRGPTAKVGAPALAVGLCRQTKTTRHDGGQVASVMRGVLFRLDQLCLRCFLPLGLFVTAKAVLAAFRRASDGDDL